MLPKILNDYFGFNKQQRNGVILLCCISALLLFVRLLYPLWIQAETPIFKTLPLEALKEVKDEVREAYPKKSFEKERNYFAFDPNTASSKQLQALGLSEKTAAALIRFREKGFVFRKKTDLKKVYGISEARYLSLEKFIVLENQKSLPKEKTNKIVPQVPKQKLELNGADSLALIELPAIGPAFAKRILKYRKLLGGFVSTEQLKEVYGFTEEQFDKLKDLVTVDAAKIEFMDLNTVDFKTLSRHPYIGYELAKAISNSRRQSSISAENVCQLPFVGNNCDKLRPYLQFKP